MITIKRDESLHLEIGKIYPRSLLHEAFRKIRGVVRKKEISDFPIIENDALLMVLHYEKNYIRTDFGRRLVSQLLEIEACNPRIEDLDFTFLQRFDGFIFAEFDEYTFLIAELVHRYISSARLFFVGEDDLWKCFFTTEEVSVLYDLKDYQVTGCKHVCFIDSNENLQPKYQPGTKCRRYNIVSGSKNQAGVIGNNRGHRFFLIRKRWWMSMSEQCELACFWRVVWGCSVVLGLYLYLQEEWRHRFG